MRRVVVAGVALGAVLLLLGFGLFPQEPVRRLVEGGLREATGPRSRLGDLELTPLLLRADFRDLYVEGPGYAVNVPEGHVALALRALRGELALRSLEVTGAVVELSPGAGAESAAQGGDVSLPPLAIDDVSIRDTRVRWRDPGGGELDVTGLSAEGALGSGALVIDVPRTTWTDGEPLELGSARARLETTPALDVRLDSLEVHALGSTLRAEGPIADGGRVRLAVDLEGVLDLGRTGAALGFPELEGTLNLGGGVEGPTSALHASLEVRGAPEWSGWPLDALTLHAQGSLDPRRAEVSLEAETLGGHLQGHASLEGDRTTGRLHGEGLDLSHLPSDLRPPVPIVGDEVELSWTGPLDAALQVEASAKARSRGDMTSARLTARARGQVDAALRNVGLDWSADVRGEASHPTTLAVRLDGQGRLDGAWPPEISGQISGTVAPPNGEPKAQTRLSARFRAGGTDTRAKLQTRGLLDLTGELRIRGDRLEKLSLVSEPTDLSRLDAKASGRARLEVRASGPMRNPQLSALVSAVGVKWRGVALGQVEVGADGTLERTDLRLSVPDLSVGGQGELRSGEQGRVRGQLELRETPVTPLMALVETERSLDGHVAATLSFDVPLDRPTEGEATLDVSELEATYDHTALRARPFQARLSERRVTVEDLRVEGPGVSLDMSAHGGVDLEEPLSVRAWLETDLGAVPVPEDWELAGHLSGAVGLRGTLERPSFEGALDASDVVVRSPSAPEVEITEVELYLQEDRLRLPPFDARVDGGRATVKGEIPYAALWPALRQGELAEADRVRLSATWEDIALGPLEGGFAGELTLGGGLASLDELEAEVRILPRTLELEGMSVEVQPATIRLSSGRVSVDDLALQTPNGRLLVKGEADLEEQILDMTAKGHLALSLLSPLVEDLSIGGSADVDLSIKGPLGAPVPRGSMQVSGVSLRMRTLPQAITAIDGRVDFEGSTASVDVRGEVGGGPLQLEGELQADAGGLGELWLQLTGRGLALRYPTGLRSRLDVDLTLAGQPGDFTLAGDVVAQGGRLDLDAAVREALRAPAVETAASELLRDVALDVTFTLGRPVFVRSSFGQLEATGRLSARGDLAGPAPFGRLNVRRGGRIHLGGRELNVTGGTIGYSGTWDADLSLTAETMVRHVEFDDGSTRDIRVNVSLQGTVAQPSLSLSSEPSLSRQEIVSVLATGRTNSSLVDSSAWLLGGQAAALLSGQLTRGVAQAFGLDEITVRPDLVARDTDPSARFTFAKRVGDLLALIYSAGLGGPETRYAEVTVLPGYNVEVRGLRRDTGQHEVGLGQRFRFGEAERETVADTGPPLEDVRFEGSPLPEGLRGTVDLPLGKHVADWRVQQQAERLRRRLREAGHLDAEVSGRIEEGVAVFAVEPGPVYSWRVEGMTDPPSLGEAFDKALFEADALDRGRARLLQELRDRGRLRAEVDAEVVEDGARREIVFHVEPGPLYDPVTVRFPGAQALSKSTLLAAADGAGGLVERPESAAEGLRQAYRARYFLAANVGAVQVDRQGSALTITVPIQDGPRAKLVWVHLEGSTLPEADVRGALDLETGVAFSADTVSEAVSRARAFYLSRGYADVRIRPEVVVEGHDLGVVLRIREGERHVIEDIHITGNTRTKGWLVRRALGLEKGQPVDPRKLSQAERRLLDLGTFSRAAIVPEPKAPGTLRVDVQEAANLTTGYDVRWEESEGWSGLVDGVASNLLGTGVAIGGRVRYGQSLREYRGSLHLPGALTGGDLTGSVFRTEEDIPADNVDIQRIQKGFQVQQTFGRSSRLELLMGYRFRRNLTVASVLPDIPIDVGGLNVSLLRITQDDVLDPRRGNFWSLSLDIAPSWLGSDAPLFKSYVQGVLNRSFHDETFTWAQSYRVGLAWGLEGEPVIAGERFEAGGPNSLRGFGRNEVGPRGVLGEPTGGEAVAIMNQELRYRHHPTGLGLAGFYDVGNVFESVGSMRLDFRHTLGVGLRWASPVGLLRVDLGFPLDRQAEEKSYRLYFGLGQAF